MKKTRKNDRTPTALHAHQLSTITGGADILDLEYIIAGGLGVVGPRPPQPPVEPSNPFPV